MQRIDLTGNLGHDPELRFTEGGRAVASLSVAHQDRRKNDQGEWEDVGDTQWFDVTLWGDKAERAAESLRKGDRVHVTGKVSVYPYIGKGQDGGDVARAKLQVQAYDVFRALPKAPQSAGTGHQGSTYRDTPPQEWTGEPPF